VQVGQGTHVDQSAPVRVELAVQIWLPTGTLAVEQSLMSCSMQRQSTFAVSIFQTHSRGGSGRQNEVDCTLQSGLSILH
jgi:hypothetical protein